MSSKTSAVMMTLFTPLTPHSAARFAALSMTLNMTVATVIAGQVKYIRTTVEQQPALRADVVSHITRTPNKTPNKTPTKHQQTHPPTRTHVSSVRPDLIRGAGLGRAGARLRLCDAEAIVQRAVGRRDLPPLQRSGGDREHPEADGLQQSRESKHKPRDVNRSPSQET